MGDDGTLEFRHVQTMVLFCVAMVIALGLHWLYVWERERRMAERYHQRYKKNRRWGGWRRVGGN